MRRPLTRSDCLSAGSVVHLAMDIGGEHDVLAAGVAADGAADDPLRVRQLGQRWLGDAIDGVEVKTRG